MSSGCTLEIMSRFLFYLINCSSYLSSHIESLLRGKNMVIAIAITIVQPNEGLTQYSFVDISVQIILGLNICMMPRIIYLCVSYRFSTDVRLPTQSKLIFFKYSMEAKKKQ